MDECLPGELVAALAAAGHDVVWVSDLQRGAIDDAILDHAATANRILVTEDNDFSALVFASKAKAIGVVRVDPKGFGGGIRAFVPEVVRALDQSAVLAGMFTVIEPGRVRSRPVPETSP